MALQQYTCVAMQCFPNQVVYYHTTAPYHEGKLIYGIPFLRFWQKSRYFIQTNTLCPQETM